MTAWNAIEITPALEQHIIEAYRAGTPFLRIQSMYHVGYARVREVLDARNVPVRKRGENVRHRGAGPTVLTDAQRQAVANSYRAGATISELRTLYHARWETIRAALRDEHTPTRHGGGRPLGDKRKPGCPRCQSRRSTGANGW